MRAVVVYESMFGNTHALAEAISQGIAARDDAAERVVVPVDQARPEVLAGADLVVVGAPTHVHGMSRPNTRQWAAGVAHKPGADVELDDSATGPGVREWLGGLGHLDAHAAAFDTRLHRAALFTGRASKAISRGLRGHGCDVVVAPESFFVASNNHLEAGEEERARAWGERLAARVAADTGRPGR